MRSMVKQTSRMAARHGGIQPRCAGLSPRRTEMPRPVATRPLWMQRVSGTYNFFYFHDGNKNVSDLVSYQTARGVPAHYEYAPFGAVTAATTNTAFTAFNVAEANPFRFSSEYADDALGLVYYNYRHYNPLDGRWTSRDAIHFSVCQYQFVMNESVSLSDYLGHEIMLRQDNPNTEPVDLIYVSQQPQFDKFEFWAHLFHCSEISLHSPDDFNPNAEIGECECIKSLLILAHGEYDNACGVTGLGTFTMTWGNAVLQERKGNDDYGPLREVSEKFRNVRFCSECSIEVRACQSGADETLKNRLEILTSCKVKVYEAGVNALGIERPMEKIGKKSL